MLDKDIFQYLLSPVSNEDFFNLYWDKKHYYIHRNDEDYFSDILSINQLNALLSKKDLFYPQIRVAKNGREIKIDEYCSLEDVSGELLIDIDGLFECFDQGATIILASLKNYVESCKSLTDKLEENFGFRTETTAYLSPQESKGFSVHYDSHSVFILQIFGTKTWRIYDALADLPTPDQIFKKDLDKEIQPKETLTLFPGDLLYIPRGVGHDAYTSSDTSLHITLAFFPQLYIDLYNEFIKNSKNRIFDKKVSLYSNKEIHNEIDEIRNAMDQININEVSLIIRNQFKMRMKNEIKLK